MSLDPEILVTDSADTDPAEGCTHSNVTSTPGSSSLLATPTPHLTPECPRLSRSTSPGSPAAAPHPSGEWPHCSSQSSGPSFPALELLGTLLAWDYLLQHSEQTICHLENEASLRRLKSDCVTQGDESANFPLAHWGIHPFAQKKIKILRDPLINPNFIHCGEEQGASLTNCKELLLCLPFPAGKGENQESSDSHLSQDHLMEASKNKFSTAHARYSQGDMHAKQ